MADREQTTPWRRIPCRTCGTEFRDDCPDKSQKAERFDCECGVGCPGCDYLGYYLKVVGGHSWAVPLHAIGRSA